MNFRIFLEVVSTVAMGFTSLSHGEVRAFAWSKVEPEFQNEVVKMVTCYPGSDAVWGSNPLRIKTELDSLPEGRRVLMLLNWTDDLASNPDDRCRDGDTVTEFPGPWAIAGTHVVRQRMETLFGQLAAAGVQIDHLVLDNETDFRAGRYLGGTGENLRAISRDPRFPALAARIGFTEDVNQTNLWYGTPGYLRWSSVLQADFDTAHQEAVAVPFLNRWPNATICNYGSTTISRETPILDENGCPVARGTSSFGTHDSYEFYGYVGNWLARATWKDVQLASSPYDVLRLSVHRMRSIDTSSTRSLMPWIGSYGLGARGERDDYTSGLSMTPYWDENVIQLVMHGCDTLLLFNPFAWRPQDDPVKFNVRSDQERLANLIADLNLRLNHASDTRWIRLPSLNESVMATGRRVTGGTLWRFSFAPGVTGIVIARTDGSVLRVDPEVGKAGAWAFERDGQAFAMKEGGAEVAFAFASDAMAWPDVNGDGSLDPEDATTLGTLSGLSVAIIDVDGNGSIGPSDVDVLNQAIAAWLDIARTSPLVASAALSPTSEAAASALQTLARPTFTFASAKSDAVQRIASISSLISSVNIANRSTLGANTSGANAGVTSTNTVPPVVPTAPAPVPPSAPATNVVTVAAAPTPSTTISATPVTVAKARSVLKREAAAQKKALAAQAKAAAARVKAAAAQIKAAAKRNAATRTSTTTSMVSP